MGSTSMVFSGTCTCGCRSSSFTTSSSESACRIEYPATSTSLSTTCVPSRCRPAPSGMPRSTTASPASFAQAIQASMPAWVCAGSPAAICSSAENGDRYSTMNLAMSVRSLQLARHVLPASSYHAVLDGALDDHLVRAGDVAATLPTRGGPAGPDPDAQHVNAESHGEQDTIRPAARAATNAAPLP